MSDKKNSKEVKEVLDLEYKKPEYEDSAYLYIADWGGANKILDIEKKFDDQKEPTWDNEFGVFWDFYIKNMVEFDSKANLYKKKYQKMQFISIIFTLISPQIISFIAMLDWGDSGINSMLTLLIAVPLTFLAALFISILGLKKYEQLFMNFRSSCERLKSAGFQFQFDLRANNKDRKQKFVQKVINIIEQQHAGFEGIFAS